MGRERGEVAEAIAPDQDREDNGLRFPGGLRE